MVQADRDHFKRKIQKIYADRYIPELDRKLTGWDYAPELILEYYHQLSAPERSAFRDAVLDLFINGGQEWQWYLIDVCKSLRLKEALPTVLQLLEMARKRPAEDLTQPFLLTKRELEIAASYLDSVE